MDDDFGDLSADEMPAPPVQPAPPKKSLFSKNIKIDLGAPEAEEAIEFFSRGKDVQRQRRAEQERKLQKRQNKLERKRSSPSADAKELSPPGEKRRRVSSQDNGHSPDSNSVKDDDRPSESHKESMPSSLGNRNPQNTAHSSNNSLSARYSNELRKTQSPKKKAPAKVYISLSDSGSESEKEITNLPTRKSARLVSLDDDNPQIVSRIQPLPIPVESDTALSDEEFPELLAAAQEREKEKALQKANAVAAFQGQNHGEDFDAIFDGGDTPEESDPIIEILITSKIEGSMPLRVKRKLSQQLKLVKSSWCDKQRFYGEPMSQELKDEIFLTWKGKKIFDFNTCSTLVEGRGRASSDGVDGDGGVHLEAWTLDAFNIWKERHEAKLRRERAEALGEVVEEVPVKKTRLVMKSRDNGDYKLVVNPNTTIQRMITAFRRDKQIPGDKGISVSFDGDTLDPESKIEDTELDDMDSVEVHIQ